MTQYALRIDKELPNAVETEKQILGAVLVDRDVFSEAAVLKPADFYSPVNRNIFLAMHDVADRNEDISVLSVFEAVKSIANDVKISDISQLAVGIPMEMKLEPLISLLKDKSLKRTLIAKCSQIVSTAAGDDEWGSDILGQAIHSLQDAYSDSLERTKPTVSLSEALETTTERWDKMLRKEIVTVETGIEVIDSQLTGGGFEKGMFHVIGARPGKGKTSFALDMAAHNVSNGKVVVFFTMELSKDVLMERFIAPLASIPRWRITSKYIDKRVADRLQATRAHIEPWPLYVNAKARTIKDMRLALRDVARQTGGQIDLIVTDFLTKMRSDKRSKYEMVSENANGLAEFAIEFNAASIALAQLNRGNENRTATDPLEQGKVKQSDFRDSGEIEELARTILGLWGTDDSNGIRDVNVSCIKQGEGSLFDIVLPFNTDFMTFGVRRPFDEIPAATLSPQTA